MIKHLLSMQNLSPKESEVNTFGRHLNSLNITFGDLSPPKRLNDAPRVLDNGGEFLPELLELKISEYLPKIFSGPYSFYDENEFMRLNTLNYDVYERKYQPYSLRLIKYFEQNFRRFFVGPAHLRIDKRTGRKKLETFLYADLGNKTFRICQWANDIVPTEFKFVKTRHKHYFLYARIPKGFIGVKYTNSNTKSVYLFPKKITIDNDFGRSLGLFASDGNKTSCLGIRNTDLFLVEQMRKFYAILNVAREKLKIAKREPQPQQKWREQFCFQFENRVLRVFLNNLHIMLLKEMTTNFDKFGGLVKGYIQGFHAGDGHCADDRIVFASYRDDPALDFIVKIVEKLGGHLSYDKIERRRRIISFCGLSNLLVFNHYDLVWHPAKLKKLRNSFKNFRLYVQFEKGFLDKLGMKNMQKILKCHQRTVYRYFEEESYLSFPKMTKISKHLGVHPMELKNQIKSIKTSREELSGELVKEAYATALTLGGKL